MVSNKLTCARDGYMNFPGTGVFDSVNYKYNGEHGRRGEEKKLTIPSPANGSDSRYLTLHSASRSSGPRQSQRGGDRNPPRVHSNFVRDLLVLVPGSVLPNDASPHTHLSTHRS